MDMKRFPFVVLILVGVLALPSRLAAQAVAMPVGIPAAEAFVKDLADRAIAVATTPGTQDAERTRLFRELFTTSFDVPAIGRFVLGRHWKTANEAEKKEFLSLFEDVTVLTWSNRFKDYKGQTLSVKGSVPGEEGEILVKSVVEQKEGAPMNVVWTLLSGNTGYRVRDLGVDGVSMAITYRSEYTSVIQHAEGKLDGLMTALRNKITQLQTSPSTASAK